MASLNSPANAAFIMEFSVHPSKANDSGGKPELALVAASKKSPSSSSISWAEEPPCTRGRVAVSMTLARESLRCT